VKTISEGSTEVEKQLFVDTAKICCTPKTEELKRKNIIITRNTGELLMNLKVIGVKVLCIYFNFKQLRIKIILIGSVWRCLSTIRPQLRKFL